MCTGALMEKVMLCINTLAEGCVKTSGVGGGVFIYFLDITRLIALRSLFSNSLHGQSFLTVHMQVLNFEPKQSGAG